MKLNFEAVQLLKDEISGSWLLLLLVQSRDRQHWVLSKAQEQVWRSVVYDMAWDIYNVPQLESATTAPFYSVLGKCPFNPLQLFFYVFNLWSFFSFFCSRDFFHSFGLLSLFGLLNASVSEMFSVGGPHVG